MRGKYFWFKMVLCSVIICLSVLVFQPLLWGQKEDNPAVPVEREEPFFDPIEFHLVVEGNIMGAFTECSGIGSISDVVEFREGVSTGVSRKIAGTLKWLDIVLTRAISPDMAMWQWRKNVEDGQFNEAVLNGRILAINQAGDAIAVWNFISGWPSSIISDGRMEAVTITHEGIWREE